MNRRHFFQIVAGAAILPVAAEAAAIAPVSPEPKTPRIVFTEYSSPPLDDPFWELGERAKNA